MRFGGHPAEWGTSPSYFRNFFGGGSNNNAAKKAAKEQRKQEEARQARVQQGVANINQKFSGFNDPFYAKYGSDYTDAMMPQFEDQFGQAKKKILFDLGNRGLINSQTAADQRGDLTKEYSTGQATIKSKADQAVDALRTNVENMRQGLIAQVSASADPDLGASMASTAAQSLRAQSPPIDTLGNAFTELAQPAATYMQLRNNQGTMANLPQIRLPQSNISGQVIGT